MLEYDVKPSPRSWEGFTAACPVEARASLTTGRKRALSLRVGVSCAGARVQRRSPPTGRPAPTTHGCGPWAEALTPEGRLGWYPPTPPVSEEQGRGEETTGPLVTPWGGEATTLQKKGGWQPEAAGRVAQHTHPRGLRARVSSRGGLH